MEDEIKFKCEHCGKSFDPDPATMIVVSIGRLEEGNFTEEEWAEICESDEAVDDEELREMDAEGLRRLGLTEAQREALLNEEDVDIGGVCICLPCQDQMLREQSQRDDS